MQNFRMTFQELGPCVELIQLALRSLPNPDLLRAKFRVNVPTRSGEDGPYSLVLEDVSDATTERLLQLGGCTDCDDLTDWEPGQLFTLNKLIHGIALETRQAKPMGHPLAVLIFGATKANFPDCMTELLDVGFQDIRFGWVSDESSSTHPSHVALVETAPTGFEPPPEWLTGEGGRPRMVVCYRLRPTDDCHFYVQWGYLHPISQVEDLYNFRDPPCHSVFLTQDSTPNHGTARQPYRLLTQHFEQMFFRSGERLQLQLAPTKSVVDLQPAATSQPIALPLRVLPQAAGTSQPPEAIETQIARYQQTLLDLERDYQLARSLHRTPTYLAYVFQQELDQHGNQPAALNSRFASILEQPRSQLQDYEYGFYEFPQNGGSRSGIHVLFDTRPDLHREVYTSLADEVYVQRSEWRRWNLPLYVRRGDDLRPRLDDREMVPQIRELLWSGRHPREEPILLRSVPTNGSEQDTAPCELWCIKDRVPLADACTFRFLNDRFSVHVLEFRNRVPDHVKKELDNTRGRLVQECQMFEDAVQQETADRIGECEERWNSVRAGIEDFEQRIEQCQSALATATEIANAAPVNWAKFVRKAIELDWSVLKPKQEMLQEFQETVQRIEELAQQRREATVIVNDEIDQAQRSLAARQNKCRQAQTQASDLLNSLRDRCEEFARIRRLAEDELEQKEREAEEQHEAITNSLDTVKTRKRELERRVTDIQNSQRERRQTVQDIQRTEQEIESAENELARQRNEIQQRETQIEERREEQRQLQDQIDLTLENYDQEFEGVMSRLRQTKREKEQVDARHTQLENDKTWITDQTDALTERQREIAELENEIAENQTNLTELQDDLQQREEAVNQARNELRDAKEQLVNTSNELDQTKTQIDTERENVQEEEAKAKEALRNLRDEHRPLLTSFREKIETLHDRRAHVETLVQSLASLNERTPEVEQPYQYSRTTDFVQVLQHYLDSSPS